MKKGRCRIDQQSTRIDSADFGQLSVDINLVEIRSGLTRSNSTKFWLSLFNQIQSSLAKYLA